MTAPVVLPWTHSCFVCGESNPRGLHLRSRWEGGKVVLEYTTHPTDVGYRQIVHGGILVTLLDEVMTWAAIIAARRMCVAAELTSRLRKPVGVGEALRVEGWVTRATSRLLLAEGAVLSAAGETLLAASGKYMPMGEDLLRVAEKDFVGELNWSLIHPPS